MSELKPCPFCGGAAMVIANQYRYGQTSYCVKCTDIHCQVTPVTYEHCELKDAIESWNRRVADV